MKNKTGLPKPKYYLNSQGEFVIDNYNYAKPFANFFPGIAGKYGIPMWVFYVNRSQCICSYGTKDKDQSILEFYPANKSWQLVSGQGFRTFIKIKERKESIFYEPFRNGYANLKYKISNSMRIDSAKLTIEEVNLTLGLKVKVEYFNIPNDSLAGLSRTVTIENIGRGKRPIELIDGLAQIVAFGENDFFLKKMSRTIEAWINIDNLEFGVPFYKLAVDPQDRPEVIHIDAGNFYFGFEFKTKEAKIIRPIVDPQAVFSSVTDFSYPSSFLSKKNFSYPGWQMTESKSPSALLLLDFELKPDEKKIFYAVSGQARNIATLNEAVKRITRPGYIEAKSKENLDLIRGLKEEILTESSSQTLNLYAGQTYLDNIMRGGYPQIFKSGAAFYLYARKHGDLERDYNNFQLQTTYFSQGNGNYRDANQNRRSDVWFNPEINDQNIISFMNLIQADGFNPLIVKGESFLLNDGTDLDHLLSSFAETKEIGRLKPFFKKPFTPGELIFFLEAGGVKFKSNYDSFLEAVISHASKIQEAEHGEGFWTDHWAYNLDLIENYLAIYPEKFRQLFFDKKIFCYFDNTETVRPRNEKYVLYNGKPRQLHSLTLDPEKKEMQRKRSQHPHFLRKLNGTGEIYYTNLIEKLLCLAVNKLASLDPFGSGIEMEANKPNWFDSLNGLPALFGSSTCETFELKRLLQMIKTALEEAETNSLEIAEEISSFILELSGVLKEDGLTYWDKSNLVKEDYRRKTRLGFSGNQASLTVKELATFLESGLSKIEAGLNKAFDKKTGIYTSYFINEVAEYDLISEHHIKPKKFLQRPLPLFLEGQMHALRLEKNPKELSKLHEAVKKSQLFDKKLKMYKVTADLSGMPEEIGRCRIFTPGWLENQSIWLHMEYKYILELLKGGLNKEFYAEFKNVLIPFQSPEKYGRSTLENSSFLVSSAYPDKNLHGNGFVARLSGSTAEFIQIWLTMNVGKSPFTLDGSGKLALNFKPKLAGWLFNRNGKYCFNFLGKIKVTYHNPKKKDTFGEKSAVIKKITIYENGSAQEINSATIPETYARKIRSRLIEKIDIFME